MKKLLALVLALVMSMSLVTISNAAFSDADKIDHKEAVEVMNALGVINGMPDGSFAPAGNVTRAEMAKMITIISIGAIDPAAFVGTATDLTDINGHWAEGYIKYCYSQGIIAGNGNGVFAPNAKVTASEAAKMLLVALGYNSDVQGYTGAQWTINVARDAQLKGFYKDLSVSALATLTRDEAAQMMYNAVNAKTIEERKTLNSDGKVSTTYIDNSTTLLENTFNADTTKGQLTKLSYNSDKKEFTYTVGTHAYTTTADFTGLYMQNVKVMSKTENSKTTVYGIYADDSKVVVSAPYYQVSDGSKNGEMKIDGTVYKIEDNAKTLSTYYPVKYNDTAAAATPADASVAATVKFIDLNGDGEIDFGVYVPFTVAQVTYAGAKSFTAGGNNYTYENKGKTYTLSTDVKKDDQVMIVAAANSVTNKVEVTKLDVLTGKVDATKGDTKVQINGTWYGKASGTAMNLGDKYDFVAVNNFIVTTDATSATVKTEDYVLVTKKAVAAGFTGNQVKILKSDGTTEIKDYGTKTGAVDFGSVAEGTLYTIDDADQSGKIVLKAIVTSAAAAGEKVGGFDGYTAGTYAKDAGKDGKIDGKAIADDAVVFVKDTAKDEYKVIAGATLKQLTATNAAGAAITTNKNAYYNTSKTTGYSTIVLAYVESTLASSTGVKYGYVTGDVVKIKNSDDKTVAQVTFWNGSEEVTLTTNDTNANVVALTAKGQAFSYKLDKDNNLTDVTKLENTTETAVVAFDGESIKFDGDAQVYDVDKDTVIIYVDTDAKTGVDGGKVDLAGKDASGNYVKNVLRIVDGDNDVNVLFVDIANDFVFVA